MSDSVPFGSLLAKIIDNRGKTCPTSEDGIPLIATNCIKNEHLYPVYEKVRYVSQEIYDTWFRGHPEPGDLIFVLKGTPGRVNWVNDPVDFCIAQDMVALRVDESKVDPKYLFAVLRSSQIQQEIEGLHVGSLIPHFKKSDFDDLQIPLVEQKLQKYIGDTYFNLSLKIDLLHRQNKTLEAMAETLFRQWFIEEAKEDWNYVELGSVIETSSGGTPSRKVMSYYEDGSIYWVKSKELNGSFINHTEEMITEEAVKKSSAKLLPAYSTLIAMYGATVGEYALITKSMTCNQAVCAVKENELYPYTFIFMYVKHQKDELINQAVGSAQQNISQILIKKLPIPTCTDRIREYHSLVNPWFKRMQINVGQTQTLEQLRDILLPKLMNGEVKVKWG